MSCSRNNSTSASERFFTLADVAERYDVNVQTIRRWVDAGELIPHRFGRQLRVSAENLKTFDKLRRGV